ncbi:MAG: hypothetical protein LBK62_06895 [Treponema sp.]|nr:hypothetical protein [Treponema sp.]
MPQGAWGRCKPALLFGEYILLLADGGGSNGSRRRQWKYELHRLSNRYSPLDCLFLT